MKTIRKGLVFFCSFLLGFCTLFSNAYHKPMIAHAAKENSYIAFGDSVPAGYGLFDVKEGYVQLFSNDMSNSGYTNTIDNYAVSGDESGDLLDFLYLIESENPDALQKIKMAGIITINIGGNNVLSPMIKVVGEKLVQQLGKYGVESITKATISEQLMIGLSLYTMTLDDSQLNEVNQGVKDFATDFPQIIQWVKENAPDAEIIVSTIYNPIPDEFSIYETAETVLKKMNAVINKSASQSGYYVADVYTTFKEKQDDGTQILNFNMGQYPENPISVDIHPNATGHKLIADIHNEVFQAIPVIVETKAGEPVSIMISLPGEADKNKTVSSVITKQMITLAVSKVKNEAKRLNREKDGVSIILNNTDADIKSLFLTLDETAVDLLKSSGIKKITVKTGIFSFELDKAAIIRIDSKTKGSVTFKITPVSKLSDAAQKLIATRPVYKLVLKDAQGTTITNLGKGTITFNIYYPAASKEKNSKLHTVVIDSKSQLNVMTDSVYKSGWVGCISNTIAIFGVGYIK